MGTGYTRNDTTNNIADGNVINAADLDGEFDAIVTALGTGGHTHDGTAAEGGPVTVLGPAQDFVVSASIVSPKTDNTLDLGTSTLEFKDLYLDGTAHIDTLDVDENANIDGNLVVGGNLTVAGTTAFNGGTITLGDAAGDSVVFGADINSSIIPNTDSAFDLGSSTQEWRDLFLDGTAHIDTLDVDVNATVAGTLGVTGVLTTTATQVATGGITSGSNIVSDTDSTDDLGTTSVRWANLFVDGITATDQITATGFTGTLDGILGSGAAATASVTTLDTSGAVNLNLTTDSTSSTSGALIVDGGVGIAKKLFVGTDLDVDGTANFDIVDIDGAVDMASTLAVTGDATFNGDTNTFASGNSTDPILIIKNTNSDASGSRLRFTKDKGAVGADGDDIGTIEFVSDNVAQEQTSFASILAEVSESADTDEAGKLSFFVSESNGTSAQLTAGLVIEGEHATDGQVDVTIAAGTASTTTVAGDLVVTTDLDVDGTTNLDIVDIDGAVDMAGTFTLNGIMDIIDATDASDATGDTGALRTEGGASIAKKLFVGTDLDVDGTSNLDVVDIDGAVDMATTLAVAGNVDFNGDLDVDGTANLDIVDIDGAVDMASTLAVAGVVTANAGVVIDEMTLDADTLTATDDFIIDAAGDIILDADDGDIILKDGGTIFGQFSISSGNLFVTQPTQDKDIVFRGNDNDSFISALTLDMSDGGSAYFNHDIFLDQGSAKIRLGTSSDVLFFANGSDGVIDAAGDIVFDAAGDNIIFKYNGTEILDIQKDGNNAEIRSRVSDGDIVFKGNDGGASVTALTLDMSEAGRATFNNVIRIPTNLEHDGDADTFFGFPAANNFVITAGNVSRVLGSASETVVNEDSADLDFRVEGNARANLFVADGGKSMLGIGMPPDQSWGSQSVGINFGISDADAGAITWQEIDGDADHFNIVWNAYNDNTNWKYESNNPAGRYYQYAGSHYFQSAASGSHNDNISFATTLRLSSVGAVFNEDNAAALDFRIESANSSHLFFLDTSADAIYIRKSSSDLTVAGFELHPGGTGFLGVTNNTSDTAARVFLVNRQHNDGDLVEFKQANTKEGSISVSGNTVAFNGFSGRHESSGIATSTAKGTIVSTIDELDVFPDTQQGVGSSIEACPKAGENRLDHAKVKVSDSVGDNRVYGVVDNFDKFNKLFVVSVGIASVKVTGSCAGGDLLESNGDGTAKVQSDDIIRSKTLGKVTIGNSNTGVKLVSCVMYCG